ncbi:hypothetical protein [Nonomuraea salmonea]|uniref:hypothetical protein n=1 Tax=Nonomuraea salmonea TaxID=46181 RepID=UPI0031EDA744
MPVRSRSSPSTSACGAASGSPRRPPVVIGTGLAMVQITDTGMGNTSGDQAVVAGPVRLACR